MKQKNSNIEEKMKSIHSIMDWLDPIERELLSDKIISYLFFSSHHDNVDTQKKSKHRKSILDDSKLNEDEIIALKKLVKKTEELRNLLGDNPNLLI